MSDLVVAACRPESIACAIVVRYGMAVQTKALAAYVLSRKMQFAGAPVTLALFVQMRQLPFEASHDTVDAKTLESVARYFNMNVAELVAALPVLAPEPVQLPPAPAPPALEPIAPPVLMPVPEPAPAPELVTESPTAVIPTTQLVDLMAASRDTPAADDHEIDVSFEEVEPTPVPEPAAPALSPEPLIAQSKSKSKKSRKKKG